MIINRDQRWVYVGPTKTGSTTLHGYLMQHPYCGENPNPGWQHGSKQPFPEAAGYTVLLSVRNPFSRAVSAWFHFQYEGGRATFQDFLAAYPPPGTDNHSWFFANALSSYVEDWMQDLSLLRLEHLQADLKMVFGFDGPDIPRTNTTVHDSWQTYYSARERDLVLTLFAEDFERFGYSTELDLT